MEATDLSGALSAAQNNFTEMLTLQTQMQQAAVQFQSQSTIQKLEFDAVNSGISRISSIGEAMSNLTNQQSQQIAQ